MIRRILNFLRELYWFRVIAVALLVAALVATFLFVPLAYVLAAGAVVFALLANSQGS